MGISTRRDPAVDRTRGPDRQHDRVAQCAGVSPPPRGRARGPAAPTELLPPPQPDTHDTPKPEAETTQAEDAGDATYFEDEHGETKDDGKTAVVAPSLLNALASRRKSTTVKTPAKSSATAAETAPKTEADTTAPETKTAKMDKTAD